MKYTLIIFTFALCAFITNAQMSFVIKHLSVSYYNIESVPKNVINEDYGQGPLLGASFKITNISADTIILFPEKSEIYFCFQYKGRKYETQGFPLAFIEKKSVTLLPNDSIKSSFGTFFLGGTRLFVEKKKNYTAEMLEILPTVRILYKQGDLELYTTEIQSVTAQEK